MNTKPPRKSRSKTNITIALEAISKASGLGVKYLRELHRAGMSLELKSALAWLENRPQPGDDEGSVSALRKERIRHVKLQSEKVAYELEVRRGQFISRDEVIEDFAKIASATQAFLRKWELEIPQLCLGLTLDKSRPLVKSKTRELQAMLADLESDFWKNYTGQND